MTESAASFIFADIAASLHSPRRTATKKPSPSSPSSRTQSQQLPPVQGEHVKTIGDAVMPRVPDPADAILLGIRITRGMLGDHGAPSIRVGQHHGPAVERNGDSFGVAVNLAARVSAMAAGGEVLVSGQTAALAPELEGVDDLAADLSV